MLEMNKGPDSAEEERSVLCKIGLQGCMWTCWATGYIGGECNKGMECTCGEVRIYYHSF